MIPQDSVGHVYKCIIVSFSFKGLDRISEGMHWPHETPKETRTILWVCKDIQVNSSISTQGLLHEYIRELVGLQCFQYTSKGNRWILKGKRNYCIHLYGVQKDKRRSPLILKGLWRIALISKEFSKHLKSSVLQREAYNERTYVQ